MENDTPVTELSGKIQARIRAGIDGFKLNGQFSQSYNEMKFQVLTDIFALSFPKEIHDDIKDGGPKLEQLLKNFLAAFSATQTPFFVPEDDGIFNLGRREPFFIKEVKGALEMSRELKRQLCDYLEDTAGLSEEGLGQTADLLKMPVQGIGLNSTKRTARF